MTLNRIQRKIVYTQEEQDAKAWRENPPTITKAGVKEVNELNKSQSIMMLHGPRAVKKVQEKLNVTMSYDEVTASIGSAHQQIVDAGYRIVPEKWYQHVSLFVTMEIRRMLCKPKPNS